MTRTRLITRLAAAVGCAVLLVALQPGVATADAQRDGEWWLSSMNITKAWPITEGAGVTVAVIDGGVDATHPDLQGAFTGGIDTSGQGSADGLTPLPSENPDHGTAMSVFIAGRGHGVANAAGLIGVAPAASLLSISFIGTEPETPAQETQAIHWAIDHGAKVINMSFGGKPPSAADMAYAQAHDVVLVAAAGNGGSPAIGAPAGFMGVVAVGGTDQNGTWDPYSNYDGPAMGVSVDPGLAVAAPASTGPHNTPGMVSASLVKDGSYTTTYGTSNSTAIVTGIVALIRAKFPTMNAANVINRLIKTATHPAGTPYSEYLGFGIPDAYAALTADIPTVCESPLGSLAADGTVASPGIWPSIVNKTTYTPTCGSTAATSSSADTAAPRHDGQTKRSP